MITAVGERKTVSVVERRADTSHAPRASQLKAKARLLTYGGILLTFGGVINNNIHKRYTGKIDQADIIHSTG